MVLDADYGPGAAAPRGGGGAPARRRGNIIDLPAGPPRAGPVLRSGPDRDSRRV